MGNPYNAMSAYTAASQMVTSMQAVVMLYDGMIQAVHAAKLAAAEGRVEDRFIATQKASKILLGLQANLDFEQGGDISLMLDRFYHTVFADLQKINMRNCQETCASVIEALSEVRTSWATLAEQGVEPNQAVTGASAGKGQQGAAEDAVKQALTLSV
ncbi:MAG: flagellar protein FliS [Pseudomonadota bacterium]